MATVQRGNGGKLREEALIPLFVAGAWVHGERPLVVRSPYDGRAVGTTSYATPEQVERAVRAAVDDAAEAAALPVHARADALADRRRIAARADRLAATITAESGKPLSGRARRWAGRCRCSAGRRRRPYLVRGGDAARHRARRRGPDRLRAPGAPGSGAGDLAVQLPLNLVAHKVAPALAVGPRCCSSPPEDAALALLLAEIVAETDLPAGMLGVVLVEDDRAAGLVADPRLPVVSFTGSGPVGHAIQDAVPRKHVVLELGGNAAAVVCADYAGERDLDWAATRIAAFGTYQAGQSCISVQRVYADTTVYDDLRDRVVKAVGALRTGDPADPHARRPDDRRGRRAPGRVVGAGGRRGGRTAPRRRTGGCDVRPTVLEDVPADAKVMCEEVFGPVLALQRVSGTDEDVRHGERLALRAPGGVFTHDLRTAFRAHRGAPWSAGSWSGTCRAAARTRCRTAAPRTPAWAARSATRWRT